jgi:hypothetical protein
MGCKLAITLGCAGVLIAIIVLLCVSFGSSQKDSQSFEGMKTGDLYYVCRVSRTAPQLVFLERAERREFAELMRCLESTPASWEEFGRLEGVYADKWFVFEQKSFKGEMIKVVCFSSGETPGSKKWMIINEQMYHVQDDTYDRFFALLDSVSD